MEPSFNGNFGYERKFSNGNSVNSYDDYCRRAKAQQLKEKGRKMKWAKRLNVVKKIVGFVFFVIRLAMVVFALAAVLIIADKLSGAPASWVGIRYCATMVLDFASKLFEMLI